MLSQWAKSPKNSHSKYSAILSKIHSYRLFGDSAHCDVINL